MAHAFEKSVRDVLGRPETHVVVLTNLSLIVRKKNLLDNLSRKRLHFQVSIDGLKENHDALRGSNASPGCQECKMGCQWWAMTASWR